MEGIVLASKPLGEKLFLTVIRTCGGLTVLVERMVRPSYWGRPARFKVLGALEIKLSELYP